MCILTFKDFIVWRRHLFGPTRSDDGRSQWPRGLRHRSDRSPAEIVGSNLTHGIDVCLL